MKIHIYKVLNILWNTILGAMVSNGQRLQNPAENGCAYELLKKTN